MTESKEDIMRLALKAFKEAAPGRLVIAVVVFESPSDKFVYVKTNIVNKEHLGDVISSISEKHTISSKRLPLQR